jgi:PKD repeat protein
MRTVRILRLGIGVAVFGAARPAEAALRYVWADNPFTPGSGYTHWTNAALTIQDALAVSASGDVILVTNGVYASGGDAVPGYALTNRVCVTNAVTVRSVNGPAVTVIQGAATTRGVYLGAGATLAGFTVTNGHTLAGGDALAEQSGGGVWCEASAVVSNCVLVSNTANVFGGGAYQGLLYNCRISGCSAAQGGGACETTLSSCTVAGNNAAKGGGVYAGALVNCIVYENTASNVYGGALTFCCTEPDPGGDNIAGPPQFVNAALGDYRLQSDSPCIDTGTNRAWMTGAADLDDSPRVLNGCVDMGAYEYYGAPLVTVTNTDATVYGETLFYSIGGTNNAYVTGGMAWTNAATGTGACFAVASPWRVSDIALAFGPNTLTVRGRNPGGDESADTVTITRLTQLGEASPEHFVSTNGANVWPYTNWPTAARVLQDAVDAAMAGDTVRVSNGIYRAGSADDSRVSIPAGVTVRSVAGPAATAIEGLLGTGWHGIGSLRCATLAANATLCGFTLTNGYTRTDSGEIGNGAGAICASSAAVLSNCTVAGCVAFDTGGGVCRGTLYNCTIAQCSAGKGGGAGSAVLYDCVVSNNLASSGGGANACTLTRCRIVANRGSQGGGARDGALYNCVVRANTASSGGGVDSSTLRGCAVLANRADSGGGGVYAGTLYNCTVTDNASGAYGGGVADAVVYNSIVYDNRAPAFANHYVTPFAYSCTTPPPGGTGNLDANPRLADPLHLSADSPCRGAGSAAYASGEDIDREAWGTPPSMGCDAYGGAATGALRVAVQADFTHAVPGFTIDFQAEIDGHASGHAWDFGDGHTAANSLFMSHAWESGGLYPVVLTASNAAVPAGVTATVLVSIVNAPTRYVRAGNGSASAPYTNWTTAAAAMQDAVNVCAVPGSLVLVTNGLYDTGGLAFADGLTNRVAITNAAVVRSVNGPAVTHIKGSGPAGSATAARCAYLGTKARLCGFTLSDGHTAGLMPTGGGAWCAPGAIVSNCVIRGNRSVSHGGGVYGGSLERCEIARNTADGNYGGGVYASILQNCLVWSNVASHAAGGAYRPELYHCTVATNRAGNHAGGVEQSLLWNSIVYGNKPTEYLQGAWSYSCANPLPTGPGNTNGSPRFVNPGAGDFRLSAGSPCIDTGTNLADRAAAVDLPGYPRVLNGRPDMGAYEYFGPPVVDITNAPVSVYGEETPFTLRGINNAYVTGVMQWTNSATGASGALDAASPWEIPGIALAFGGNPIHVYGASPDGTSTSDAATVTRLTAHGGPSPAHFADREGGNVWPYTHWTTAARAIQDAVDAARAGDVVWVTNGLYDTGGRTVCGALTNRVAIDKAVTVHSVTGPGATCILGAPAAGGGNGDGAIRCAYVGTNACLVGFTLTNGHTRAAGDNTTEQRGGGVWCASAAVVSNCVVFGNSAHNRGGGAAGGTLWNCLLAHNSSDAGGGAYQSTLMNCTVVDNTASSEGGGAFDGTAQHAIVCDNTPDNLYNCGATYSCSIPLPGGDGNIDTPPSFADRPNGDYRLNAGSAGIDAGSASQVPGVDLDGIPRPLDGNADGTNTVDMGAYEFVSSLADSDGDRQTDRDECTAGTDPLDPDSFLGLFAPAIGWSGTNPLLVVSWRSVDGKSYGLDRSTNLLNDAFGHTVRSNIVGIAPINTETDAPPVSVNPVFYRVRLE